MFERSFHFIPANRPEYFSNACGLPADALILDLEDAVPNSRKNDAISFISTWLRSNLPTKPVYVRVNGLGTPWMDKEMQLLEEHPELGLVLPKLGSLESACLAMNKYDRHHNRSIILLVEELSALSHLPELASIPGIKGLGIGFEDLLSKLCTTRRELPLLVAAIRTQVAMHCAASGILAIDSISHDLSGGNQLQLDATAAREAGMVAMFSIHPAQLETINRAFSPTPNAIAEARHLVSLAGHHMQDGGYLIVEGTLISPPKLRKAEAIIEFANHHEI